MMQEQIKNKTSLTSQIILGLFALALLFSIYSLFTLPSDLKFKGNLQYFDLVTPVLVKLYISLAITVSLAIAAIYFEMKNTKVAIIFKEKTEQQRQEEKIQAESSIKQGLDSNAVSGKTSSDIISNALTVLANKIEAVAGACYIIKDSEGAKVAELLNGFALPLTETDVIQYKLGEGLVGQVAKSGTPIFVDEIPEGYFQVVSGLGTANPKFIMLLPLKKEGMVKGILEVATFKSIKENERKLAEKFVNEIGERLS